MAIYARYPIASCICSPSHLQLSFTIFQERTTLIAVARIAELADWLLALLLAELLVILLLLGACSARLSKVDSDILLF